MASDPDFDRRIVPARPDLAALHLKGKVEATTFASGQPMRVTVPIAPLTAAPDGDGEMASQLLFGEDFMAYEVEDGWAWGQSALDGYVGYVPDICLGQIPEAAPAPTHRVIAHQALVYPDPDFKSRPIGALPFGARVSYTDTEGAYAALDAGGWAAMTTLRPAADKLAMWVSTAERMKGVAYLWGGRSTAGLDCSGLIQLALQAAHMSCPRDSDQQMAAIGRDAPLNALRRGDLVFWKGHVGVLTSPTRLLHANIHHMEVVEEQFETARTRIAKQEFGEIIAVRRITV